MVEEKYNRQETGERWESYNIDNGWDMDDIKDEFDSYWEQDESIDFLMDQLDLEVKKMLQLLERGVATGKVDQNEFAMYEAGEYGDVGANYMTSDDSRKIRY